MFQSRTPVHRADILASLVIQGIQVLDGHPAGRALRLKPRAGLPAVRELDAGRFEGSPKPFQRLSISSGTPNLEIVDRIPAGPLGQLANARRRAAPSAPKP
jgi:hypothetical protein